ncbi:hypothetical protein [Frankia sp. AgB32]|uniref:hypothetical protein n=1 Tax=Frankia sp. AgB32 TaxID=631119 RepID=UPI00200FB871|nr:hypothetical protein [Frankia sp. AgB32]MCK9897676.1 hypothetical protein [Frankia sp. AgB32]
MRAGQDVPGPVDSDPHQQMRLRQARGVDQDRAVRIGADGVFSRGQWMYDTGTWAGCDDEIDQAGRGGSPARGRVEEQNHALAYRGSGERQVRVERDGVAGDAEGRCCPSWRAMATDGPNSGRERGGQYSYRSFVIGAHENVGARSGAKVVNGEGELHRSEITAE